jgi:hypothetical protein
MLSDSRERFEVGTRRNRTNLDIMERAGAPIENVAGAVL